MRSFPRGHAYDPLPDFNYMDPVPFPIPRRPIPLWRRLVAWGLVGSFVALLVASGFEYVAAALFVVLR